mmetsp:Transcript_143991/g.203730  ORF Transcript_143991/g.203730 Transcript_143991/m.203730 type:complete len:359 (-) Transcript_143991:32-1108(-)
MVDLNKYLGLLRWSLKYSDGTSSEAQPMDEERRKFLMAAIEENMVDPVDQMKTILKVLETPKGENVAEQEDVDLSEESFIQSKVESLEHLQDFVENLDLAEDFIKIGGLDAVLNMLMSDHKELRSKAAEILATLVQNHPKNQKVVLEKGGLDMLMRNWNHETCSTKERVKLLLAIASLIRGSNEATKQFLTKYHGVALLLKQITETELTSSNEDGTAVDQHVLKLQRKALFLVQYIITAVAQIRPVICKSLVQSLTVSMFASDIDIRENSLQLLEQLVNDPACCQQFGSDEMNKLKALCRDYTTKLELEADDPARSYVNRIMKACDSSTTGKQQPAQAESSSTASVSSSNEPIRLLKM